MSVISLPCGACGDVMSIPVSQESAVVPCPQCGVSTTLDVFPALWREQRGSAGERLVIDDDSACFYHPEKKAAEICDGCGRFLCSLCDIPYVDKHLCASCLEKGTLSGKDATFKGDYMRYDMLALTVAVAPMLIFYFTIFTAPIALFLAIRFWRAPLSPVPRSRWRFIVAIAVSVMQIIAWLGLGIMFGGAYFYFVFSGGGENAVT